MGGKEEWKGKTETIPYTIMCIHSMLMFIPIFLEVYAYFGKMWRNMGRGILIYFACE